MNFLVFVYGSLKEGFGNHGILEGSEFICSTRTKGRSYRMISLDAFPAVLRGGKNAISGELYQVDLMTMLYLDMLESNGELYERKLVELESGHKAWMYCFLYNMRSNKKQPRVLTENRVQTWTLPTNGESEFFHGKPVD
jgi:gamma-glutamylcyclotransferase (GGCT)/AIG2-like uncharacterized protein YtfP